MKHRKLNKVVSGMTRVERAILFTAAELWSTSSELDKWTRLERAKKVAQSGKYWQATMGVADKLSKLAKKSTSFETILDALIRDNVKSEATFRH